MSVSLAPPPFLQFQNPNNSGSPAVGFQLFTYIAGTSTKQSTWTDSTQTTQNANPLLLDGNGVAANGSSSGLWGDPTLAYKLVWVPANDTDPPSSPIRTIDNLYFPLNLAALTQALIGSILYPRTAAEIAAGVTPVNFAYPPGYEGRFGMMDDGATDNTMALQHLINGSAGNVPVIIRRFNQGSTKFYAVSSFITVPANTHIILEGGAEIRWTATTNIGTPVFQGSATRPGLLVQGNNFTMTGYGKITGPSIASYTQSESAIMGFGTSRTVPFSGFTVEGEIEFSQWGWGACFIQFFTNVRFCDTYIHNVGYIGAGFASCAYGVVQGNRVDTVTPGSGGNAYGITCTHDSTAYSSDPNAATNGRITANPFCTAFDVAYNTVTNIPIWEGIDAHGGYELHFHHNNTYNCAIGIALAGGSGAATAYSGEDNEVSFNNVYLNQIDGTATTATPSVGIELKGGTTVLHRKVRCIGNTVDGYGNTTVTSYSIEGSNCVGLVVSGNIINNWEGYGFYETGAEGIVADNVFLGIGASATGSVCVMLDTTTGTFVVSGNKHHPESGTAAAIGLRINNTANPRCLVKGNDFSYAVTPFGGFADGQHTFADSYPIPAVAPTGNPTTIDVSACGAAPLVDINLAVTGNSTVSTITGTTVGQILRINQTAAFTTTIDRTQCALPGSANVALTQNQVLQLLCIATSGTKFIAMSSVTTNG